MSTIREWPLNEWPESQVAATGGSRAQALWDNARTADRIADVTREIADDSVSLVLIRNGVALAAQTVRLLIPSARGQQSASVGGTEAKADLIVLGTSALNIERGDTFLVSGHLYRVIYVAPEQPSSSERREAGAVQVQ
jgi:hypothetical protein